MKKNLFEVTILLIFVFTFIHQKATAVSSTVRISQVYGGGGNSGAIYQNDFIELFNASASAVNLSGWSIQYAAATSATWHVTNLSGVINAGGYLLIQMYSGGAVGMTLPTPDVFGVTNLSATEGKIALINNTTTLNAACPSGISIIDFIGYGSTANCYEGAGTAPAPSNTKSVLRASNGCIDTDNNASDFSSAAPAPRNSSSNANVCSFTGIADLNDHSTVNIWSNQNVLNIDFTNAGIVNATIEIYNMLGQLLSNDRFSSNSTYSRELSTIEPAFIIVKLQNEDRVIVKKLVILNQ